MSVSIKLSSMFLYSLLPIIITLVSMIIIFLIIKPSRKKITKEQVIVPNYENMVLIKNKYLLAIDQLNKDFTENNISLRSAYQTLSKLVRNFVYEVTNIKVQNYTLDDIKDLNLPILYELISEYYNPEFSINSSGNFDYSIKKTRGVIEKWNWDIPMLLYFLL